MVRIAIHTTSTSPIIYNAKSTTLIEEAIKRGDKLFVIEGSDKSRVAIAVDHIVCIRVNEVN